MMSAHFCFFFFFNDTATTEIYTLSLHDALPILAALYVRARCGRGQRVEASLVQAMAAHDPWDWFLRVLFEKYPSAYRSEEHTSELQSRPHLVCRLLLEKKKHRCTHTSNQAITAH